MKNVLAIFMLFIGSFMTGCNHLEDENSTETTVTGDIWEISASASGDEIFKYQLMENYPTEGGPKITKEPRNATVSEISYDNGIHYIYQPEAGFTGTDEVEITTDISAGGSDVVAQTILRLTIEVTE